MSRDLWSSSDSLCLRLSQGHSIHATSNVKRSSIPFQQNFSHVPESESEYSKVVQVNALHF